MRIVLVMSSGDELENKEGEIQEAIPEESIELKKSAKISNHVLDADWGFADAQSQ